MKVVHPLPYEPIRVRRMPSECHPHGERLDTGGLPRYPAWSPDGRYIALVMAKNGVWVLDLESLTMELVLQDPRGSWMRPLWGLDGCSIWLSGPGSIRAFRRTATGWQQHQTQATALWTRWAEWMTEGGCAGIGLPVHGGAASILVMDVNLKPIRCLEPRLHTGEPLRIWWTEFPCWWVPGESILVTALDGTKPATFVVDTATGVGEPTRVGEPARGRVHCYARATAAPTLVGFLTSDQTTDQGSEAVQIVKLRMETAAGRVGARDVAAWNVSALDFHSPVAVSPDGERVVFVSDNFELELFPLEPTPLPG